MPFKMLSPPLSFVSLSVCFSVVFLSLRRALRARSPFPLTTHTVQISAGLAALIAIHTAPCNTHLFWSHIPALSEAEQRPHIPCSLASSPQQGEVGLGKPCAVNSSALLLSSLLRWSSPHSLHAFCLLGCAPPTEFLNMGRDSYLSSFWQSLG